LILFAFKNTKKEKIKIKKKKREKERKGKVEGPLWFWPSHTSPINSMLQEKNGRGEEKLIHGGEKIYRHGGEKKIWKEKGQKE